MRSSTRQMFSRMHRYGICRLDVTCKVRSPDAFDAVRARIPHVPRLYRPESHEVWECTGTVSSPRQRYMNRSKLRVSSFKTASTLAPGFNLYSLLQLHTQLATPANRFDSHKQCSSAARPTHSQCWHCYLSLS